MLVIGLVLTCLSAWASARVDASTEQRLLEGQTAQVGVVLTSAVQLIQGALTTALRVQPAADSPTAPAFRQAVTSSVGQGRLFTSAGLWRRDGRRMVAVTTVGAGSDLDPDDADAQAFLGDALGEDTFTVWPRTVRGRSTIIYALADPGSGYVVAAERMLPANRRSPVDDDSAFADLSYAIYIGPRAVPEALSTTDVDPDSLPMRGRTARTTVPFGNTVLTVVTSPRRHLGAQLSQRLPLLLLAGGVLLTLVAAGVGRQLVRRGLRAEEDARTVTALYDQVEALYDQERVLSERLQRALLPPVIPEVPDLEVAVEYVAGAHGVDIGGDWYSLIPRGEDEFAFVVGDVSGRGIDAVAVMARARFTLRAYLLRGDSPSEALEMAAPQFDIVADGHIATTVVGVGSWRTGEISLASAGHPDPLLLTADGAEYVRVRPGPPLGTGATRYPTTRLVMPPGSTLFCYTDGLIERRGESIDTGMERLADTVLQVASRSVSEVVAHAVRALRSDDAEDDIAVLALRRTGQA